MSPQLQDDRRRALPSHQPPRLSVERSRLTARGRIVVVVGLMLLLLGAFSLGRARSEAASGVAAGHALTQTTVHSGETLWSIAADLSPGGDTREVVERILEVNHLQSAEVRAGQQLLLPDAT